MSGPRNRAAFELARRERDAIRQIWAALIARQPFRRWTARHVMQRLPAEFQLSERSIQQHMQRIAREADEERAA